MNRSLTKFTYVPVVHPAVVGNRRNFAKYDFYKTERYKKALRKKDIDHQITFLALDKLFSENNSFLQTIFWSVAIIMSCAACIWHVTVSTQRYFEYPTSIQVSLKEMTEFKIPNVAICANDDPLFYDFRTPFYLRCEAHRKCNKTLRHHYKKMKKNGMAMLHITLKDLWYDQKLIVKVARDFVKEFHHNSTQLGRCVIVNSDRSYSYENENKLQLTIHQWNAYNGKPIQSLFAIASSDGFNKYNIKSHLLRHETKILALFSLHEYHLITNCVSNEQFLQCNREQDDKILQHNGINCSVPYFKSSNLHYCRTIEEARRVQHLIFDFPKCNQRMCNRINYRIEQEKNDLSYKAINKSRLVLSPQSQFKEVVNEYYIYPMSALLADLATGVGTFLGISLLSIFEFIHALILKFRNLF